jgi:hypothetical protein
MQMINILSLIYQSIIYFNKLFNVSSKTFILTGWIGLWSQGDHMYIHNLEMNMLLEI